jgi:hypothetical protein
MSTTIIPPRTAALGVTVFALGALVGWLLQPDPETLRNCKLGVTGDGHIIARCATDSLTSATPVCLQRQTLPAGQQAYLTDPPNPAP